MIIFDDDILLSKSFELFFVFLSEPLDETFLLLINIISYKMFLN